MSKSHVNLTVTEAAILQAAATIYNAHLSRDNEDQSAEKLLRRSAKEAIFLAKAIDEEVVADGEMG